MALPLPPFFDESSVSRVYRVPYQERAAEAREWARLHGLRRPPRIASAWRSS